MKTQKEIMLQHTLNSTSFYKVLSAAGIICRSVNGKKMYDDAAFNKYIESEPKKITEIRSNIERRSDIKTTVKIQTEFNLSPSDVDKIITEGHIQCKKIDGATLYYSRSEFVKYMQLTNLPA